MKRFILVGGKPFTGYNGASHCTSINIVGSTDTVEEMKELMGKMWDECGGLMLVIDRENPEAVI